MALTLRYWLNRVRRSGNIPPELLGEQEILQLFSDAYQRTCERARCLPALEMLAVNASTAEYVLPSDHVETLLVYDRGWPLEPVHGPDSLDVGYYMIGSTIGFVPAPVGPGTVPILYLRRPSAIQSFEDELDPVFGREWWHMLLHHARWRALTLAGGAGRIAQANAERDLYNRSIRRFKNQATHYDHTAPQGFSVPSARNARRRRLARDVDAR